MKQFRMGRNTTEHYSSFEEMGKAWGCKQVANKPKTEERAKKLQEQFYSNPKHKCKACGEQMTWIGGNQLVCTNDKCKGIKVERENPDGTKTTTYVTSYYLLEDDKASFAKYIFS